MKISKSSKQLSRLLRSARAEERNFAFRQQTATTTARDRVRNRSLKAECALRTFVGPTVPAVGLVRDAYKASLQLLTQLHQSWDNSRHAQKYSSKLLVNLRANKSLNFMTTSFVGILVLSVSVGSRPGWEMLVWI